MLPPKLGPLIGRGATSRVYRARDVSGGGEVAVIEGEPDNLKITIPEDLARAERIAAGR